MGYTQQLTLMGRYDLSDVPFRPVMPEQDLLFYHTKPLGVNTLRKAIFGVSDNAFTTLDPQTLTDFGYAEQGGMITKGEYLFNIGSDAAGTQQQRLYCINRGTGAVTWADTPTNTIALYGPSIVPSGVAVLGQQGVLAGDFVSSAAQFYRSPYPAVAFSVVNMPTTSPPISPMYQGTIDPIMIGGNAYHIQISATYTGVPLPHNLYNRLFVYKETPGGVRTISEVLPGIFRCVSHGPSDLTELNIGFNPGTPTRMQTDSQNNIYMITKNYFPGVPYMIKWAGNDLPGPLTAHQQEYLIPGGTTTATSGCIHAFHIDKSFNKMYYAVATGGAGTQGFVLQHCVLPYDPADVKTFNTDSATLLGTTGVTGIWTFPPYVYVTKGPGTAAPFYGNQLLKFYDPDLDPKPRSKRRGGELWDIVPEVAPYFG
jgi:hypothetical protein